MKLLNNIPVGAILQASDHASLFDVESNLLEGLIQQESLVILRGFNSLTDEQMCDFAQQFGDLLKWDFGYVMDLKIRANPLNHIFSEGRVELHWDGAFACAEPKYNFFQCNESSAASGGGETTFLDTVKFLACLPEDHIQQLTNIKIQYKTEKKAHYGGEIQVPLISAHPTTNKPRMRFIEPFNEDNAKVNPVLTKIMEFTRESSESLLRQLTDMCYQSSYFYAHQWKKGDFLLVDNQALLHGRNRFRGYGLNRALKRVHIL